MPQNAVILHHPDGVETQRERLMGRHAAGAGFLRGFVRHAGVDGFFAQAAAEEHFTDFVQRVEAAGSGGRACRRVPAGGTGRDGAPPTLMAPTATIAPLAWQRRRAGSGQYGICGVNHTISSPAGMDGLGDLLVAPLEPWDAVICTSAAARAAMHHVLDGYAAYLNERTGGRPRVHAEMPVIPLGVDCEAYRATRETEADRMHLRRGLGIEAGDVVLLYVGRLSFHAKAHPLPMYLAAEAAARQCAARVHLIQAGWFASESIERQFREGARALCPSVNPIFLDGRDPDVQRRIWRAADVFVSFSDNTQETFGLAPVEAMAAGLPVVVSDWDGYRDTVRDGVTGFTVPTWAPGEGAGDGLAMDPGLDLANESSDQAYNAHCGSISQATAVDVAAASEALCRLVADRDRRRDMGSAGRDRAESLFDWRVVVSAYQDLWQELDRRRREAAAAGRDATAAPVPLRDDPFAVYRAYPTHTIGPETVMQAVPDARNALDQVGRLAMNTFASSTHLDRGAIADLLDRLATDGSTNVSTIVTRYSDEDEATVVRTIGWMAKMGLVRLTSVLGQTEVREDAGEARDRETIPSASPDIAGNMGDPGTRGETLERELEEIEPVARSSAPNPRAAGDETEEAEETEDAVLMSGLGISATPDDDNGIAGAAGVEALKDLAREAHRSGDLPKAALCFRRILALDPTDPDANNGIGELLASAGRLDQAVESFRRALRSAHDHVEAHRNLGKALFLRGGEAEGIHSFRRAVQLAPEDAESRFLLGAALRRAGAVNEAVQCLKIAIELDPGRWDACYHLGLAFKSLGRREEALRALADGLNVDPENRFILAAQANAAVDQLSRTRTGGRTRRIALHMGRQFHYGSLRPVFDVLSREGTPLLSADNREITEFGPDLVVTCSPRVDEVRRQNPGATVVSLMPGFVRRQDDETSALSADAVVAAGPEDVRRLLATDIDEARLIDVGCPALDVIFRGERPDAERRMPVVLFAPTVWPDVSAADILGEDFAALIKGGRPEIHLVVKPHPLVCEGSVGGRWLGVWTDAAAGDPLIDVANHPGTEITGPVLDADVIVTDVSSAAFVGLAADKPVVVVGRTVSGPETQDPAKGVRDMLKQCLDVVFDPRDLAGAVARALESPRGGGEARARGRARAFGDHTDGHAAARLAERLLTWHTPV